jgi:hypothetical protein
MGGTCSTHGEDEKLIQNLVIEIQGIYLDTCIPTSQFATCKGLNKVANYRKYKVLI